MITNQVDLARAGDDVAFTQLVDLHGGRCYGIAYRILRDSERAEDAVQQAIATTGDESSSASPRLTPDTATPTPP